MEFCYDVYQSAGIMTYWALQYLESGALVAALFILLVKKHRFPSPSNHTSNIAITFAMFGAATLLFMRRMMPGTYCRGFAHFLSAVDNVTYISICTKLLTEHHVAATANKYRWLGRLTNPRLRIGLVVAYLIITLAVDAGWINTLSDDDLCGNPFPYRNFTLVLMGYLIPFLLLFLPLFFFWRTAKATLIEMSLILLAGLAVGGASVGIANGWPTNFLIGPGYHLLSLFFLFVPAVVVVTSTVRRPTDANDDDDDEHVFNKTKDIPKNKKLGGNNDNDEEEGEPLNLDGDEEGREEFDQVPADTGTFMTHINNMRKQLQGTRRPAPMPVLQFTSARAKQLRDFALSQTETQRFRGMVKETEALPTNYPVVFALSAEAVIAATHTICDVRMTQPLVQILLYLQIAVVHAKQQQHEAAWQELRWVCQWIAIVQLMPETLQKDIHHATNTHTQMAVVQQIQAWLVPALGAALATASTPDAL